MKKTYSKLNGELSGLGDKENKKADPFDELFSSPIKQNIQFQPLSFWGKKEKKLKSRNKPRKVKCELFESSESDEIISPNESSGFIDKKRANADSFDETLTAPLKLNTESQSQNFYFSNEKESLGENTFIKDECDDIGSSDSNKLTSICELSGHKKSFLTGLQNVTKRRGISYDSFKKYSEEYIDNPKEIVELDCQLDFDKIIEPTEISSLQNVTKRRGIVYNFYKKNIEEIDDSVLKSKEVELDTLVEIDETLKPSQKTEKISSRNFMDRKSLSGELCNKNNEKFNDSLQESEVELDSFYEFDQTIRPSLITKKISSRNITKRRGSSNDSKNANCDELNFILQNEKIKLDSKFDIDQTLELTQMTERLSFDSNNSIVFARPILESTRVQDLSFIGKELPQKQINRGFSVLEETKLNFGIALKPGKEWLRSMSVLKQIQNGSIVDVKFENTRLTNKKLESSRITGRKFESFVKDLLEMQNSTLCEHGTNNFLDESDASLHFSDNCSILSKSFHDKSMLEKSLLNYTVKVVQSEDKPSALKSALGLEDDSLRNQSSAISAKDFILIQCGQADVLSFEENFNQRTLRNCKKIGEGVYGEVFKTDDAVIKIIPIEGADKVNGESQKTFEEIISEVVIASKLSNLRKGENNRTCGFSELRRCWCVEGKYPKYLLELWDEYDQMGSGSENDSPIMFKSDQLYIILELANGGKDLESFVFSSSAQSLSIFIQVAFSLAVAEKAFEFEHRDLHWGNVLISPTKDEFMTVVLNGIEYKIPTKGVKVCIIDFTLSRISHEGCCIFNDLSVDPGLFASEGDYQFEIYRMMLREVQNDWSLFRPKTNIYWLHYMLDKMIKMVRYKNKKAKLHTKHQKNLHTLKSFVLKHTDCGNLVLSDTLYNIRNRL